MAVALDAILPITISERTLSAALIALLCYPLIILFAFAFVGRRARATGDTGGLRPNMGWLHTWGGLWFCWLLYAVFLTGTLAVFEEPITHWMTPEHHLAEAREAPPSGPVVDRERRLQVARDYVLANVDKSRTWSIWPGDPATAAPLIVWERDDQTAEFTRHQLDPASGQIVSIAPDEVATRATWGGHHFVEFHHELHAGKIGLWIVAIATIAMLVTLISGVIIHKRIFKDFFTFRPRKGQRSWLDAHNALAVLTLPFQFMIAFTGIAFYATTYIPVAPLSISVSSDAGDRPAWTGTPAPVPQLEPFAARASTVLTQDIHAVVMENPGDVSMRVRVYGKSEDGAELQRISRSMGIVNFDAQSGAIQRVLRPGDGEGPATTAKEVMDSLHMAEFGGWPVKWLYFICGMAGTAMIGTGAALFMVKRRARHGNEFGKSSATVYRVIEGLNVAAIAGLGVACIAYLWANRLIPVDLANRASWELRVFFVIWLVTLAHGMMRPPMRAWIEQFVSLAVLCLALPLVNVLTNGDQLFAEIGRGDLESAGVEMVAMTFGLVAIWIAHRLHRKGNMPSRQRRPVKAAAQLQPAE